MVTINLVALAMANVDQIVVVNVNIASHWRTVSFEFLFNYTILQNRSVFFFFLSFCSEISLHICSVFYGVPYDNKKKINVTDVFLPKAKGGVLEVSGNLNNVCGDPFPGACLSPLIRILIYKIPVIFWLIQVSSKF